MTSPLPSASSSSKSEAEAQNARNRELAVHHATLLQQRKDTESLILAAIEELIEFPTSPRADSRNPDQYDMQKFQELITPFAISDYKDLIEERNIAGKCGYVFCPKPLKRSDAGRGDFMRIVRGKAKAYEYGMPKTSELRLVPNSRFDKCCDKWCAHQALYIQMQLSEAPAWERVSRPKKLITAADESMSDEAGVKINPRSAHQIKSKPRDDTEGLRHSLAELALERGGRSEIGHQDIKVNIVHRERLAPATLPDRNTATTSQGGSIEGHVPRAVTAFNNPRRNGYNGNGKTQSTSKHVRGDDEMDTDWDLT